MGRVRASPLPTLWHRTRSLMSIFFFPSIFHYFLCIEYYSNACIKYPLILLYCISMLQSLIVIASLYQHNSQTLVSISLLIILLYNCIQYHHLRLQSLQLTILPQNSSTSACKPSTSSTLTTLVNICLDQTTHSSSTTLNILPAPINKFCSCMHILIF